MNAGSSAFPMYLPGTHPTGAVPAMTPQPYWQPPISVATPSPGLVQNVDMHQQHQWSVNTYSSPFNHVQPSTYHPCTFSAPAHGGGAFVFPLAGTQQLSAMRATGLISPSPGTAIQHTCPMPTPLKELILPSSAFSPTPIHQVKQVTPYSEAAYMPSQFYPKIIPDWMSPLGIPQVHHSPFP